MARNSGRNGRTGGGQGRTPSRGVRAAQTVLSPHGLPVELRRSAAARRLSLRVSRLDGRARLTAPVRCDHSVIAAFLEDHGDWLSEAVAKAPTPVTFGPGVSAPYLGRPLTLTHADGRRGVHLDWDGGRLWIGGPAERLGATAALWLREQARAALLDRSHAYAQALGVRFSRISIRDTRSRWGSCSSTGALSYSWRLVLAPPEILDYVAAHEVAHLREMNHSARFWALVQEVMPDWRPRRRWLRENGADLHRYQAPSADTPHAAVDAA